MLEKATPLVGGTSGMEGLGGGGARAKSDSGTEIVNVPLGILQVADIRCVF